MSRWHIKENLLLLSTCALILCIALGWIFYSLLGFYLLDTLYRTESPGIVAEIMENRAATPLKDYHQAADRLMVVSTFLGIALFVALVVLIKNPWGVVLICGSSLLCFSLLFFLLELFPSLINSQTFIFISYYAYKANYIADDKLVYREKPFVSIKILNFQGSRYSPIYKVDATPTTIEWATDEEGFRNRYTAKLADVVVMGDSFIEYGDYEADTFGKRLEKNLSGFVVINLGKAGYGPFQYLEVFKKYGVKKSPKYALFCFFEGNDIDDIQEYLAWQKGEGAGDYERTYTALTANFPRRYIMALTGTIKFFAKQIKLVIDLVTSEIWEARGYIHPYVAVLNMGDQQVKMLLDFKIKNVQSADILLKTNELEKLKEILSEFKLVSEKNGIVPIMVYIPTQAHIYAEYSTPQSGSLWRKLRPKKLLTKKNLENAIWDLSQELQLELINLSPVFEQAAKEGKVLYYTLDSHWNAEGREVAATFVAKTLKDKFATSLYEGEKDSKTRWP